MKIDLFDAGRPIRFGGILDTQATPKGLRLLRLPVTTTSRVLDPALAWTASVPSGARLEVMTNSTSVEFDVQLMRMALPGRPAAPAVIDLVVDGELRDVRRSDTGHVLQVTGRGGADIELIRGGPDTIRFDGLGGGEKRLEVWLPHNASLELRGLRLDDGASVRPAEPARQRWVHYGSSISHCLEADRPTGVWPAVAARQAGVDLMSLGLAGQAQLDQAVAKSIRDLPADFISMKVGINVVNGDTMRERTFVPAVHGFLDTVREGHPRTPLVVVTPIICPLVEEHPGPTLTDARGHIHVVDRSEDLAQGALSLSRIRELLTSIVELRQQEGDRHLHLMSGLDLFGSGDVGDLPDGLHPNAEGYRRMGARFYGLAFGPDGPFASADGAVGDSAFATL
jgi:hypothetical protein